MVTSALNNTGLTASDIAALGITNQRETTIVWHRKTGQPYHNAIVWQDTRTDQIAAALDRDGRGDVIRRSRPAAGDHFRRQVAVAAGERSGRCVRMPKPARRCWHPDVWVLWNMTGGPHGGVHITDPTNASRTMLMNLETPRLGRRTVVLLRDSARAMLPAIRPSSSPQPYGLTLRTAPCSRGPVTASLGDQQAAMVWSGVPQARGGQEHLRNRKLPAAQHREKIVRSQNGLLTTVCYQFGDAKPVYALRVRSR